MKSFIAKAALVAALALAPLLADAQWAAPTATPPSNNASTPLNISGTGQTKVGGLTVNTGGAATGFVVSSGNAGIGTGGPGADLEIYRDDTDSEIRFHDPSNAWYSMGLDVSDSRRFKLNYGSYAGESTHFVMDSSGNVGIGVAPSTKFEVSGVGRFNSGATYSAINTGFSSAHGYSTGNWGVRLGATGNAGVIQAAQDSTAYPLSLNLYGGNVGVGVASPSYKLHVGGDIYANGGWLRVSGAAGLYFESYGGGWYMEDSTWIRSYNSKPVYMSAGFDTGSASGVGCGGGLGGGYTFRVCGTANASSAFYSPAFYYSSDSTLKKDVAPLKGSLAKVLSLEGVSFSWKDQARGKGTNVGLIAQDVEKVYPELVGTDPETGLKSVEYGNLVAPLIEAVKEQQRQIDALKSEVEALRANR